MHTIACEECGFPIVPSATCLIPTRSLLCIQKPHNSREQCGETCYRPFSYFFPLFNYRAALASDSHPIIPARDPTVRNLLAYMPSDRPHSSISAIQFVRSNGLYSIALPFPPIVDCQKISVVCLSHPMVSVCSQLLIHFQHIFHVLGLSNAREEEREP